MWRQIKPFNQITAGKVAGYCLQNVRKGFGINSKYPNAINAWYRTQQHRDKNIPMGVDVPLYYTYRTDGHINVRLANGQVWNDGRIWPNLTAYTLTHPLVRYQGWGESINDVRVIQWVEPPKPAYTLPPVGSKIQLIPTQTRTTFKAGTANVAGSIKVTDNSFVYIIRGYDHAFKNRVLINSASAGGNGVSLALYYLNGTKIDGWRTA